MAIIKANAQSEAGELPSQELLNDMGRFNAELVKAGVLLAGEGLKASSNGVRVKFDPENPPKVVDGPFTETKELVAGFWVLEVRSMDEAIEWIRRVPNTDQVHHEIEIRPIFEAEDFGERMTPQMREAEEHLREQTSGDVRGQGEIRGDVVGRTRRVGRAA
jgi:hypothetical protein